MKYLVPLAILFFISTGFGYVLHLVTPVNVYLQPLVPSMVSPVGPGYKVILAFDRNTKEGFVWDNLVCTTNTTWKIDYAKDHKFLYAFLHVPRDANGNYTFSFTISDVNGDHVQENSMVTIHVTRNPSDLVYISQFSNKKLTAGNDTVSFHIKNKALGEARYRVEYSVKGVYGKMGKDVVIAPGADKVVSLPVRFSSEGFYEITAKINSEDTPIINDTISGEFYVRPTLYSKVSSIMNGFPVIPIPLSPVYTILGFFAIFW